MITKKIYHAAIYVRLSKEDGDIANSAKAESNSISNQKNLIKDFLKDKEDIVVVSERVDDGYSGSNFERPAFQMMLEDIKKGTVDCVVVKDLSRFGREYIDSGRYIERLFPALGVRFIAVNDNYDSLEGKDQSDEIIIPFKNLINDAYCRDISIKIRSHLEVKRKNGEYIGSFTPFGYRKSGDDYHKIVIDPYAANVVKDIFRMKLHGMSQEGIAGRLNEMGILPPAEYKASTGSSYRTGFKTKEKSEWTSVMVRRILTNEVYIGNLVQGRRTTPNHKVKKTVLKEESDWVRIEKNHEPVVGDREFEIVQRLLSMDTRTAPEHDRVYPLSGLAVCGDYKAKRRKPEEWTVVENCHEPIVSRELYKAAHKKLGRKSHAKKVRPDNSIARMLLCGCCGHTLIKRHGKYKCPANLNPAELNCSKVRMDAEVFEDTVMTYIRTTAESFLQGLENKKKMKQEAQGNEPDVEVVRQKIRQLESRRFQAYDDYTREKLSRE